MEQMIENMFSDNPNLPEELYTFCNSIPDYVRAEREYLQIARQVADRLGYDLYNEFEEKLNDYMAQQLDAWLPLRAGAAAGAGRRADAGGVRAHSPKRPAPPPPAVRAKRAR